MEIIPKEKEILILAFQSTGAIFITIWPIVCTYLASYLHMLNDDIRLSDIYISCIFFSLGSSFGSIVGGKIFIYLGYR